MRQLKDFKYNNEKFSDIKDFSELIETFFHSIGYENGRDYNCYKEYYLCFNPFIDGNNKSATIYYKDGNMLIYNSAVEVVRQESRIKARSITVTEYHRLLGKLDLYIDFILLKFNIDPLIFNQYKSFLPRFLMNEMFGMDWKLVKGIKEFRRFLFMFFITDKDILKTDRRQVKNLIKKRFKKPAPKSDKPKPEIKKVLNIFDTKLAEKYMTSRKIPLQSNVYPTRVSFKGGSYSTLGICFEYPNGFKKVRFIDKNSSMRYLANANEGAYEDFFEAKVNHTKHCLLLEGEIESLSLINYTDKDIYAMHNTNALPTKNLTQLMKYDIITVLIDYDTFDKVKSMIEDRFKKEGLMGKVEIRPKIVCNDKKIDFNSLLVNGKLTQEYVNNVCIYE